MGDEALSYLRRRADVSDVAAEPQPYQVVYSVYMLAAAAPFLYIATQICSLHCHPTSQMWLPWADDSAQIVMTVRF